MYKGRLLLPGAPQSKEVAILQLRKGSCDTEANIFMKLGRHPRLVRFYGQCIHGDDHFLITELARHGSMSDAFEELSDEDGESYISLSWWWPSCDA